MLAAAGQVGRNRHWLWEFQPLGAAANALQRRAAGGKANLLCNRDERGQAVAGAPVPTTSVKWRIVFIVPHLHRSQIRWCPALCVGLRLSAAISGSSRQEFPTMVALEPQLAGHSSPAPIHDEFPFNPFVMTFETEGNKKVARSFQPAIEKTAPTLDFYQGAGRAALRMTPTRH